MAEKKKITPFENFLYGVLAIAFFSCAISCAASAAAYWWWPEASFWRISLGVAASSAILFAFAFVPALIVA